jgi:hypothetical protein
MKNDFPCIHLLPETRRKMIEIAPEPQNEPTRAEEILCKALRGRRIGGIKSSHQQSRGLVIVGLESAEVKNYLQVVPDLIRKTVHCIAETKNQKMSSPRMGEDQGGG